MATPKELLELIERFNNNREAYHSGSYNETQLRREFVDPFFEILGWDINNEKGYAEAYKDVIHEDSIKVGGATKAPDYCFRIGGTRKFFVETKKPSVNLKDDISPAFQLRRYAWSAKLPLSILTDFEEFAVYDCRAKPDKSDKSSTARILYLTYTEYAQRWDEISQIFSHDAVLKGSFDKYAESSKVKKGTASVDDAFLQEIESWRDTLARNLALRNPELSQRDLNFAVQRTIDRIVFLRICEDRGMEQYGRLMTLQNGDRVYARLCEMFHRADERYNSGLFHFQKEKSRTEPPDTLTIGLIIDDKPLKDIIKNLYYPDSPYEFSVLSADILGQVYEQFLGKVIRLTAGHRAVVEEKPEVRKAGGVYYTPTYIVDYIVKNTVGQLVKSKIVRLSAHDEVRSPKSKMKGVTPKEISKIRILDPACGSGSFLLGAYQYLLDWHRDWYVANDPEKWATGKTPVLYQSGKSEIVRLSAHDEVRSPKSETDNWRLTTAERRRILLNNIYGVDIDPQAVEVTKLSLLLKVLEGESEQTLLKQFKLFHERTLPDLGNNIKCGNSLIGTDFYNTPLTPRSTERSRRSLFEGEKMDSPLARGAEGVSDEERYRINVFDWEREFPEIMKNGGFDVVIGNPPYFNISSLEKSIFNYLAKKYPAIHTGYNDIMYYFIYQGIELLKGNGVCGMITSNYYLGNSYAKSLRNYLKNCIVKVVNFENFRVFANASIHTAIFIAEKKPVSEEISFFCKMTTNQIEQINLELSFQKTTLLRRKLSDFWLIADNATSLLIDNINKKSEILGKLAIIEKGSTSGKNNVFTVSYKFAEENGFEKEVLRKNIKNSDIDRYYIKERGNYLIYIDNNIKIEKYPNIFKYLCLHKQELSDRNEVEKKLYSWYRLERPRNKKIFDATEKLVIPYRSERNRFAYDNQQFFNDGGDIRVVVLKEDIKLSIKYILGLLNSSLLNWHFGFIGKPKGKSREYFNEPMAKIPIRAIDLFDITDKARHDRMVALVDQMLELHKQLASAKTDHDKTVIQRQIDVTDRQIDQLVYELYGLTEEEIKIVEEGKL